MPKLIITPEITNEKGVKKLSRLAEAISQNMSNPKILYLSNLDAESTAITLRNKIIELAESRIPIKIESEEILSRGTEAIAKYLENIADEELERYLTSQPKMQPLIFVVEQETANTLPNYFWKNILKAQFGGVHTLQEGQAVFFKYRKQRTGEGYSPYSCTLLP